MALYFLCAFFLFFAAMKWAQRRINEHRARQWQETATRLGLQQEESSYSFADRMPFLLFAMGETRRAENILFGDKEGCALTLADYIYRIRFRTLRGPTHSTFDQTVCILQVPDARFPRFALFPDKFTRRIGYDRPFPRNIGFAEQELNADMRLFAEEQETLDTLAPLLRAFLDAHPNEPAHLECADNLLLFHWGRSLEMKDVESLIERTREAAQALQGAYAEAAPLP